MNTPTLTDRPPDNPEAFRNLIAEKHKQYYRKGRMYARLYYLTRLAAGISAGALPFVVRDSPGWSTFLAIIIVMTTVIDTTFSPKDRWALFSSATDLLTLSQLKALGMSKEWQEAWKVIERTERAYAQRLIDLNELLDQARAETKHQTK